MTAALPAGRLAAAWTALVNKAGAFKAAAPARVVRIADKQMVITPCEFERATSISSSRSTAPAGSPAWSSVRPPRGAYTLPPYAIRHYAETGDDDWIGEWALPATLTMPAGTGPLPAVVLVHGSGPDDRDETVGANKPFKDLAAGLASRGIAVLRYDKRTKVHGAKVKALKTSPCTRK